MQVNNASVVAEELREYKDQIELKLQLMLAEFAQEVVTAAAESTPLGSQHSIDIGRGASSGAEKKYYDLYAKRAKDTGIAIEAGYHQGAWDYSNTPNFTFRTDIRSIEAASQHAGDSVGFGHQLGEDMYIGAKGPGFSQLERGLSAQAPEGIGMVAIPKILAIDLKRLYDKHK